MSEKLLSPIGFDESEGEMVAAQRTPQLDGKVLGLLDNSKGNAQLLLESVAELLGSRHQLRGVVYKRKPSYSRRAPAEMLAELAEQCDLVLTAVGD